MIQWIDLFLQLFVQALAFLLAGVTTIVICFAVMLGAAKIYGALPLRRRR